MSKGHKSKPVDVEIGSEWYRLQTEAFDPTVIIGPPFSSVYNCTTCRYGAPEHPAHIAKSAHTFRVKCMNPTSFSFKNMNEGPRNEDIGCQKWERGPMAQRKDYEEYE